MVLRTILGVNLYHYSIPPYGIFGYIIAFYVKSQSIIAFDFSDGRAEDFGPLLLSL